MVVGVVYLLEFEEVVDDDVELNKVRSVVFNVVVNVEVGNLFIVK